MLIGYAGGIRRIARNRQFENDRSPVSTIVKGIKRAIAGEYGREFSAKGVQRQSRLTELGFRPGGPAGYGWSFCALQSAVAWQRPWQPRIEAASVDNMALPLPNKPSIAVLPFTNMSDDAKQEYFADGMTDDLITELSKVYPELMIRMLLVGYVFAIRSERRICAEVRVNLAYRWLCRLSIEDTIPDHSAFSRARHERFRESEVLQRVFERVVATCIAAGLVGGEAFSIDASLIRADVDQTRRMPGEEAVEWPKPEEASRAIAEYLEALDEARATEDGSDGGSDRKPPKQISLTDPGAAWVARTKMSPFFAYDANYLIDNRLGIIVDAEGTRANRSAEIAVTETKRTSLLLGGRPAADLIALGSPPQSRACAP